MQEKIPNNGDSSKNITPRKQQNNRQFYATIKEVCTIGTRTCFAAASMYFMSVKKANHVLSTSSTAVIVSLYAIGAVCAIIAMSVATEWYLILSSKLAPTELKTFNNGKQW
ncbi:MAG: hypothetical protein PV340_05285 [Wolbachia sp.]|nr:hypothetical protein [Wolbachia sp.]MDD9336008.1 hypothetical protein [Wolbachia sp.]